MKKNKGYQAAQVPERRPAISRRDFFAGQALAGILANPATRGTIDLAGLSELARSCFYAADAMLKRSEERTAPMVLPINRGSGQ